MAKSREINMNLPSADDLFTTQEERDQKNQEHVKNISVYDISDFPNHPFKVKMDAKMVETIESIREHGVLVPALVREKPTGGYEMISGHRRKMASELAGLESIPCIVRNLSDDEAVIVMVDSNLQREEILPSEKAFAYKMRLEAMNRQAGRPSKNNLTQGSATLKDAAFAIISLNENPVLVEGKLYKKNETVKTIQTGIDGVATTSADLLPYGKYKLEETKAPEGYLTDGAKAIEFSITENGKIVDLTGESHSIYNQIKRGDLEGVKIGAGTHKRLANVPFKITSKTTGESHIVVTDKNGQFSTASDWASHKKNTNAGTSSEDGIWFGISEPDDSKGALLYDTYEIEELSCESNKGMKLIPAFEVVVSRNKVTIDLGTLTDEYEKEITIHTTATDKKTGEKVIVAGKKVTIVDTVTLDGLEEGRKYQLKGWQMLKEENAELLIDGKRVESDYTFVADSEKMKVEISYTFDASELGGQNLVTFEELYDLKNPEEPVKVAEHKDIDDEGQTVLITERKISIHTTATDKNGKKEVEAGKDLTIVDAVTLEGLEIGTNYKLSGWQMVKAENAKLLIDGKEVTNDYEFTADKENMEVQIEFTFNGSTLGGKQLVTFEELYDMTNPEEPKKVTEHKDINDEGQTVTIKEVPETPTPETPGTTTKTSNPPKTGDTANAILWIAILVLSAAGITGVRIWNKKKQVKRLGIEEKKEEEE